MSGVDIHTAVSHKEGVFRRCPELCQNSPGCLGIGFDGRSFPFAADQLEYAGEKPVDQRTAEVIRLVGVDCHLHARIVQTGQQ